MDQLNHASLHTVSTWINQIIHFKNETVQKKILNTDLMLKTVFYKVKFLFSVYFKHKLIEIPPKPFNVD